MTLLQAKATEAWAKMIRPRTIFDTIAGTEPMPSFAAIDYVQDAAEGDRELALNALAEAACGWLADKYPERAKTGFGGKLSMSVWLNIAIGCVCHIASMHLPLADESLSEIYRRVQDCLDPRVGGLGAAASWDLWRREAQRAIEFLRELEKLVSN